MSSLPPALLARLKKRGIIKDANQTNDSSAKKLTTESNISNLFDAPGCPHKCSLTHFCNEFCVQKFGDGKSEPSMDILRLYEKLVHKYPLPDNWIEVWEPGMSRFYFWNTTNDQVCWYPPNHPKAKVTMCALKLKEEKRANGVSSTNKEGNSNRLDLDSDVNANKDNDKDDDEQGKDEQQSKNEESEDAHSHGSKGSISSDEESSNTDDDQSDAESSDRESIDSIDEQLESVYD